MNRQQHHAEGERLLNLADHSEMEHDAHRDRLILASIAHALLALSAPDDIATVKATRDAHTLAGA
jgi:hypothetical protein